MTMKRKNNEGSIYKYKSGYRTQITLLDGRRISKSFPTEIEALSWKNEQLNDLNQGSFVSPTDLTVGEWAYTYLETYAKPRTVIRTYERYLSMLPHLSPIGNYKLQDLRPIHIQKLLNEVKVKRGVTLVTASDSTKKKVYSLLMMIYKQAIHEGITKVNPVLGVKTPKQEQTKVEVFTKEEIELMKVYHEPDNRNHLIALIALATGMRLSEILGLRWIDIDFEKLTLSINQTVQYDSKSQLVVGKTKNEKSKRTIGISQELADVILKQPQRSNFVLSTIDGKPLRQSTLESWWKKFLADKGIVYKKFHALRHTHATLLVNAGIPITDISSRLGHSKTSTTLDIYAHSNKCDKNLVRISSDIIGL